MASFDLVDFDDGPTVVTASPIFHAPITAVMDRRQMPPPISGVMPVSAPVYAGPAHAPPSLAPPSLAPASVAPPSVARRRHSSPEFTQPALRVRRDLAGTRRLAWFAISAAFVFGLAGAFAFQTMNAEAAPPTPMTARAPRSVTERSSTLDTKSTPDAVPRAEAPLASVASAPRTRPKRLSATPPATTEAGEEAPAPPESDPIEGRDLLGEGIGQ